MSITSMGNLGGSSYTGPFYGQSVYKDGFILGVNYRDPKP